MSKKETEEDEDDETICYECGGLGGDHSRDCFIGECEFEEEMKDSAIDDSPD